ncbi:MAG: alpha/beta fold hydrolase [Verrucomicrobia bacterium]|nr:alpha/beta fold hydrolase [Verrucomicrobiota bacterium]
MQPRWGLLRAFLIPALFAALAASECSGIPHFEAVPISSKVLRNNPLGDPADRRLAVFRPENVPAGSTISTVYYLPGYGGSSEDFLGGWGGRFSEMLQSLCDAGTPLQVVVVDCRNRWGGSQYINSTAQGNYADYFLDEVVPLVEAQMGAPSSAVGRILAGHSSGGFGALRLAMMRPAAFGAVVALSPDTDFEVTHRELASRGSRHVSPRQLEGYKAPIERMIIPSDGLVQLLLGLSAAYAPRGPDYPGDFDWLYGADGRWREDVWKRWLQADPVVIARGNPRIFSPSQRIYLDGAECLPQAGGFSELLFFFDENTGNGVGPAIP